MLASKDSLNYKINVSIALVQGIWYEEIDVPAEEDRPPRAAYGLQDSWLLYVGCCCGGGGIGPVSTLFEVNLPRSLTEWWLTTDTRALKVFSSCTRALTAP